jgi:ribonuclease P protein component
MLAKNHRLTRREDFSALYSQGAYAQLDGITLKYMPSGLAQTRIGFPIGKNFSKKAVERNRARRILQQACRTHIDSLKSGFNIVVMLRPGHKELTFSQARETLQKLFQKANLFKQ